MLRLNRYEILGLCFLWCAAFSPVVSAKDEADFSLKLESLIQVAPTGDHRAFAELGYLPMGKSGSVQLKLINQLDDEFAFSEIVTNCSCLQATLDRSVIGPGQSSLLQIRLSTSQASSKPGNTVTITLKAEKPGFSDVTVVMHYHFAGLLTIPSQLVSMMIQPDSPYASQSIPLLTSPPVEIDFITTSFSPEVEGAKAVLSKDQGGEHVEVQIPAASVPAAGLTTRLQLHDQHADVFTDVMLVVSRISPVRISPLAVRLQRNDTGNYVSQCILRVQKSASESSSDQMPIVDVKLRGTHVTSSLSRMADDVYRVKLSVNEKDVLAALKRMEADGVAEPAFEELSWTVRASHGSYQLTTPVALNAVVLEQ